MMKTWINTVDYRQHVKGILKPVSYNMHRNHHVRNKTIMINYIFLGFVKKYVRRVNIKKSNI